MPELIPAEPGTPEWHAARKQGVTATDIVTILGLSRRDSQYSLFWRKLGQVPEVEDSDRFRLGRELEPYVVARWLDEHPEHLAASSGLYRHDERSWQMATIDRGVVTLPATPGTAAVLECKTWADADRHSWDTGPPPAVRAQVLWQMDVMGVAAGHVGVVFLPSGEFRSHVIEHDQAEHLACEADFGTGCPHCPICNDQDLMLHAGEEFMGRLRLELPPPDPDSSLASLAAVRARFTRQPAKQAEIDANTWNTWLNWSRAEKSAADLKREAEIKLRHEAGEAGVYTVEGEPVARRVVSDAPVRAHVRHQDYLRRVKQQGDDDELCLRVL